MKSRTYENAQTALSNEAAEWFIRLCDTRLSLRHREHVVRWLKASPAHIAELLRIHHLHEVLCDTELENQPARPPGKADSNVIELLPSGLPSLRRTDS